MDYNSFKSAVAAAAKAQGIADYELYYESSEDCSISTFRHEINQFSSSLDGGVCFRCIVEGKMGYASTEELSESQAASLVSRAADNARTLESEDKVFLGQGGQTYESHPHTCPEMAPTDLIRKMALKGDELLYAADPMVADGSEAQVVSQKMSVAIMNSNGLDLSYESGAHLFIASSVLSNGTEMATDFSLAAGDLNTMDIGATVTKSVTKAKAKLGADVAPTGAYPVVFAPEAMGSLLSTFSGIFNAERVRRGLSRMGGKEGQVVASPIVTLVDDPFYKDSIMPLPFDAEGTPTYQKNVIENGVLNTLLYDLKAAAAMGKQTTGNAAKRNYSAPVGIMPFTMYLAPGDLTEEELLQKAGNGVYITSLGGLHAGANPISGDFSLQSSGFMIEDGVKTKAVKSFTVAGNFYTLLTQITALSNEVKMPGFPGKTAFASPAVLVEGLTIAGK